MFEALRKPGTVFVVPMEQYCADALGAATKRLPSKARPTSRRHISHYSSLPPGRYLNAEGWPRPRLDEPTSRARRQARFEIAARG
jgi:hypothetical protein